MPTARGRLSVFTAVTVGLLLVAPGTTSARPSYGKYVALGDSYAAGPLIPNQRTDPLGCFRSSRNYAALVAGALAVSQFVDVTCSSATTEHMTQPQSVSLGTNPPQFAALTGDTELVTVTIGGNDVGFGDIVRTCASLSATDPLGNPCERHFTSGGTDQLAARIAEAAPKISAVLDGISQRAPRAKILLVGYLRILPPSGGCWPVVPIAVGDVSYLDTSQGRLNAMLGQQAAARRVGFVNPGVTTGHDVCQAPNQKWVEGFLPTRPASLVHPNAAGMAEVARLVLASRP